MSVDVIIAIAVLIFWVLLPVLAANRIGRARGHRYAWLAGLLGGWIGVLVAWVVLPEEVSEPVAAN